MMMTLTFRLCSETRSFPTEGVAATGTSSAFDEGIDRRACHSGFPPPSSRVWHWIDPVPVQAYVMGMAEWQGILGVVQTRLARLWMATALHPPPLLQP